LEAAWPRLRSKFAGAGWPAKPIAIRPKKGLRHATGGLWMPLRPNARKGGKAGVYSAVTNYLKAVQAAKTDDAAAVMRTAQKRGVRREN